ncbi:MAG: LPS-assembly protein LptD [Alphaproteobacteria bacterium]|nr:LPS-assembly protein LptD [Alphaproteobacteria bacterium]
MSFYRALCLSTAVFICSDLLMAAAPVDLSKSTTMKADQVTREEKFGLVVARGNVEIVHDYEILQADTVTYNEALDQVSASGNVRLKKKEGDIVFAQYLQLSGDLKEGVVREIRMILSDDSKLAATRGERESGTRASFDTVSYTPCNVCRQNPTRPPLWHINARRVVIDEAEEDIIYTDAIMNFWDVPVMYLPYFSHPAPNVKRRAGFLSPTFGNASGSSGAFVRVPYFIPIGNNKDVTVAPLYADHRPGLQLSYRQRFAKGYAHLGGSGIFGHRRPPTQRDPATGAVLPNPDKALDLSFRGHIVGRTQFDLTPFWRVGANLERATDQTYFRRLPYFGFKNSSYLMSKAYAEHFKRLDYFSVEGYSFQGLREGDRISTTPLLLPVVEYSTVSRVGKWGETWSFDAGALGVNRRIGTNVQRFSMTGGVQRPFYSSWGDVYTVGTKVRGDIYNVHNYKPNPTLGERSGVAGRLFPQLFTHWRYPFVKIGENHRSLLEPRAGLFVAPNTAQGYKIPNEDSLFTEFNTYNLFAPSRFAGLDLVDTGSRFAYGLGGETTFPKQDVTLEGFLGQNVSFNEPRDYLKNTGLEYRWSHYVGRLEARYDDWMALGTRMLLNRVRMRPERQEFLASLGKPILRLSADYVHLPTPQGVTAQSDKRRQIVLGLSSQITREWMLMATTTRELGSGAHALSHGGGVTYQDECFTLQVTAEKSFFRDRDVKPGVNFMFRLVFKNLGEVSHQLNLGDPKGSRPDMLGGF